VESCPPENSTSAVSGLMGFAMLMRYHLAVHADEGNTPWPTQTARVE
jgi:hypothetical protein